MSIQARPDTTDSTAVQEGEAPALSKDDAFELLSNRRRRYALHHLKQRDGEAALGTLSERIAAWENGVDVSEITSDQRKNVYTSLQQFHLPKMDDQGVVEFDERAGAVELSDRAEELDVYLEVVESGDVPWSQYYLGLSALNLGLVAAALLSVPPLTLLPAAGVAAFVATTYLVSALVHTYINSAEMHLGTDDRPPEVGDG